MGGGGESAHFRSFSRGSAGRVWQEFFPLQFERAAVRKLERGLRTDVAPIGEGAQSLRVHYGPGYRIYFGNDGTELVVLLLCDGKRAQGEDIAFAKAIVHLANRRAAFGSVVGFRDGGCRHHWERGDDERR